MRGILKQATLGCCVVLACVALAGCDLTGAVQEQVCPECEECTVGTFVDDLLGED